MPEYIEREAVLVKLREAVQHKGMGAAIAGILIRYIEKIPAADVAPVVHGRWVNKTNPNRAVVEQRVDCSVCGHIFWHTSAMSYNYCPNCGARMEDE